MHMCTHKEKGPLIIQNILCYALLHDTLLHTFCCCFIKYRQSSLSQSSYSEAVIRMYSVKNMFLEILQNSQENTGSLRPATLSKKRLWRRYFPVNFAKFLRTPYSAETHGSGESQKILIRLSFRFGSLMDSVQLFCFPSSSCPCLLFCSGFLSIGEFWSCSYLTWCSCWVYNLV